MRRLLKFYAITVALVSVSSLAIAAPEQATSSTMGAPAPEPLTVNVDLVVDTLSEQAQLEAAAELERQFAALAEEHGLIFVERDAAILFVRLELNHPDKSAEVFLVDTVAVYDGEVLPRENTQACIQCGPAQLVEDGLKVLLSALEQIEDRRAEAATAAQAKVEVEAEDRSAGPPASPLGPSAGRLGVTGYVGISSSVLGLGGTIAGSVLLARREVDPSGNSSQPFDYRPPGRALVGVGLGMMVVGTVLLAVDLAVLEQRRRSSARVRLDSVSVAAMHGPAILISGRF